MTVTRISLALGLTVVLWAMLPARLSASEELNRAKELYRIAA